MEKSPAINWYFDNWGGGTKTLSRFLKGCYMDLLDAQFHSGHLSLDEIKYVLGADFSAWQTLQKKFKQDVHGNYFNERLDHEILKRKKNSEEQSKRANRKWELEKEKKCRGISRGITVVMPDNETAIEIEDKGGVGEKETKTDLSQSNLFRKPVIPSQSQIEEYFVLNGGNSEMAKKFFIKHSSTGWYLNGSPIIGWQALAGSYITTWRNNESKNKQEDQPKKIIIK